MSKRMRLVFTVSVLLNIVLVAVGAGMLYRYAQDVPIPGTMSPDARNFVARTYQNGREEVKPLIQEVKARRKRVETILQSRDFDRKAYDEAVDDLLETQGRIARHRADTMGRALNDLSAEDRRKFSKEIMINLAPGKLHKKRPQHHKSSPDKAAEKRDQ